MIYMLLKALHIIALMAWIGGMLLQVFLSRALAAGQRPGTRAVLGEAVRWDRWMTTPAMLLAWICGLALANGGQWLGAPWLSVKLVLVVVLSALHGMQSGSLRRMAVDPARHPSARSRRGGTVILGTVAAIVLLVVLKP